MGVMFTCPILNTNVTVTDMDSTVEYLERNLDLLRGKYICVSNVHTTMTAFWDENYRIVQNSAALALPDGKPLSVVSRRRGFKTASRVPGPDLMTEMFKISEEKGYTHFFYGSTEETLEKLRIQLLEKYPGLNIVGMYSPPFRPLSEEEDIEDINRINDAHPDFIWVGLGAPKQELWMYDHMDKLQGVMLGVGAGFDFHAGTIKRAPKWMQEMCLEWLYRLLQDPKRLFKRYAKTNVSFMVECAKENRTVKKEINKRYPRVAMIGHKRMPSREGGVEIVVEQLSVRLAAKGYRVDAYNRSGYHVSGKEFDTKHNKVFKGVRIITIPTPQNGKLNAIVYTFLATVRALVTGYDLYHIHAEGPCAFLWLLKLFKKHVIVTIHGLDWQRAKWGNFATRVLLYGEKQAVKHADEIIVLSENVKEYFKKTYQRETTFIPNGVMRPELKNADEMTEKWGIEANDYVLFLARLVPEKGVHYLIDAFSQTETEKKLVIAGGSSHSDDYVNEIFEKAEKDPRIIFTHFVQGRKLEELYSNAYIFVLPSDVEGMAISLLEAMSYGNCCLVSDIKENTEVVGEHAVTFKKGDVSDLKEKLEMLLNNPKIVEQYKENAADYVCGRYDWDLVTEEVVDLYERN